MPITCTYDFEIAGAKKYFDALENGEIPLMFRFSGTTFYETGQAPCRPCTSCGTAKPRTGCPQPSGMT